MPVTRLLALSALLITFAGSAFAQSQENAADLVAFQGAASMNVVDDPVVDQSTVTDTFRDINAESNQDSDRPTVSDDSRHSHSISPFNPADSDRTCLFIRDYRVIRDSPQSDSTHRDGYTTCVPAARFRMYTTLGQDR